MADQEIVIVGAGLAGLLAARQLGQAGWQVTVLDKGRGVGGRLATGRFPEQSQGNPLFDHGAQFFTVRDQRFQALVDEWLTAGVVEAWSRGFATADGSYYADGYPRYRGVPGMTAVAKQLAQSSPIHLNTQVTAVTHNQAGWQLHTAAGPTYQARHLLLTPPVPQSLALLAAGQVPLPPPVKQTLKSLTYEPCLALLLLLDGPGQIPEPGGLWPAEEPLVWVADNYQKGVSPVPGAITLHAGPEFSQQHWTTDEEEVLDLLREAARPWLGQTAVRAYQLHRWRYSKPVQTYHQPYLALNQPHPLLFAGDIFAGPRVEGAALSGLAAAEYLIEQEQ